MAYLIILAIVAFVFWRLVKTDTNIRPQESYTANGEWNGPPEETQIVHYVKFVD